MDRMARMVGLGGSSASEKPAPAPKAKSAPSKQTARAKPAEDKKPPAKQTATADAIRPKSEPAEQQTASTQAPAPASSPGVISGAQPTVPTGSFDNRFGAWR